VLQEPDQEMTLDLFRRGAHSIVSREVEPELLVECLRKVAQGEPWLESRSVAWVMQAYRTQGARPAGSRPKVSLTPKESLIVSCVTQGMKNKEIALRVGTTEQVVKNYLRKVYDKLGVADRLELGALLLESPCARRRQRFGEASCARFQPRPTNGHAPPYRRRPPLPLHPDPAPDSFSASITALNPARQSLHERVPTTDNL
jgi:DNA-binding CsgD family transcriptional regulator